MDWNWPIRLVPEAFLQKGVQFLIHQYLGKYISEKVNQDDISINMSTGFGEVENVILNVEQINADIADLGLPFALVDGFAHSIKISVPWHSLSTVDPSLEITGLHLTLHPESGYDLNIDDSIFSETAQSMSQSAAEHCISDDPSRSKPQGLESFAKVIESLLKRVKLKLIDTKIRIEHSPPDSSIGLALQIEIHQVEFYDETTRDLGSSVDENAFPEPSNISIKNLDISGGVTIYTDIFLPLQKSNHTNPNSSLFHSTVESLNSAVTRHPSYMSSSNSDRLPQEQTMFDSNPIKILELNGLNQLQLKSKSDHIHSGRGPKTEIAIALGSLGIFLTPKQLQVILEVISAYTQSSESEGVDRGDTNYWAGSPPPHNGEQALDEVLQTHLIGRGRRSSNPHDTESCHSGVSLESAMFESIAGENSIRSDLMSTSLYSSRSGSSLTGTSLPTGSTDGTYREAYINRTRQPPPRNTKQRRQARAVNSDDSRCQTNKLEISIGFIAVVLLHESPITTSDIVDGSEKDVEKMKRKSDRFFDGYCSNIEGPVTDLPEARDKLQKLCLDNHLMLLIKKPSIEIIEISLKRSRLTETDLILNCSISQIELTEYLKYEPPRVILIPPGPVIPPSTVKMISFNSSEVITQPCLKFKLGSKYYKSKSGVRGKIPDSNTNITLTICRDVRLELDISISDRLYELINRQPLIKTEHDQPQSLSVDPQPLSEIPVENSSSDRTNITITSRSETALYLRFPIADLRRDPSQRYSYKKRNLCEESLEIVFTCFSFNTCQTGNNENRRFEVESKSIRAYFHNGKKERVAFAHIGQELGDEAGVEKPRILIKTSPKVQMNAFDSMGDHQFDSIGDVIDLEIFTQSKYPSPFSQERASVNQHEVKIPACKSDIERFEHHTKSCTELYIQIDLPAVNIIIPNKQTLVDVYNCVCNDLLLWESLVPKSHNQGLNELSSWKQFRPVHSTQDDSDSTLSDQDYEDQLYSLHTPLQRKIMNQGLGSTTQYSGQSRSCVSINIKKGRLTLNHIQQAGDELNEMDYSQSALDISDGVIYVNVNSFGDPNLQYIDIHAQQATFYHNGSMGNIYSHPSDIERLVITHLPSNLTKILELCPPALQRRQLQADYQLSVSIEIKLDTNTRKNIKYACVAVSLNDSCLHHAISALDNMWIMQLIESIALKDKDVLGYEWPVVCTEVHIHIQNSAIDYKPDEVELPTVFLTLGKFSMTSNIVISSHLKILRFLFEDTQLYLTRENIRRSDINLKDFAVIAELPALDLEFRISEHNTHLHPRSDIRLMCGDFSVKLCADTILYLISLGDHIQTKQQIAEQEYKTKHANNSTPQTTPVNSMMNESQLSDDDNGVHGGDLSHSSKAMLQSCMTGMQTSMYHSPDMFIDDTPVSTPDTTDAANDVMTGLAAAIDDEDSDDEFGFEFVDGNVPKSHEAIVTKKDSSQIELKEHYLPTLTKRVDLLNPPANFPHPETKLSIEGTFNLYIFGGQDFGEDRSGKKLKREVQTCVQLHLGRIKSRYDVYPITSSKAQRLCIMIQTVEIIDKVSISKVNKLLALHINELSPVLDHAGTFMTKLICTRPHTDKPNNYEWNVRVAIQPLSLNIDQDTLWFISSWFNRKEDNSTDLVSDTSEANANMSSGDQVEEQPILHPPEPVEEQVRAHLGTVLYDDMNNDGNIQTTKETKEPVFIKSFVLSTGVSVHITYMGKHKMLQKSFTGVLCSLAHLNDCKICLTPLNYRNGIRGWDKLLEVIITDYKKQIPNLVPNVVFSVGPLNSFKVFGEGLYDLVYLPYDQVKKDGRAFRGMQKGLVSFLTNTSVAIVGLTADTAHIIHKTADSINDLTYTGHTRISDQTVDQPRDMVEGFSVAARNMQKGYRETWRQTTGVFERETETKGAKGIIPAALYTLPKLGLAPLILLGKATSDIMNGTKHQIKPDTCQSDIQKYKPNPASSRDPEN